MTDVNSDLETKESRDLLRFFAVLVAGTIFFSALLTPLVYYVIRLIADGYDPWPFSRVYNRVAMGVALIIIVVCRRGLSFGKIRTFFITPSFKGAAWMIFAGFLISSITALVGLPYVVASGKLVWADRSIADYLIVVLKVLPAAIIISVIEEVFFRLIVFLKLCRSMHWLFAAVLTSMLYSVVHFVQPVKQYVPELSNLMVGFDYTFTVIAELFSAALIPAYFGLFLVGMVLAIVLQKTGSIYLCIGLHAGWVLAMKLARYATKRTELMELPPGVNRTYYLASQWSGYLAIAAVLVVVMLFLRLGWFKQKTV